MEQEFNYDQDLGIDPYCLDEEWLKQPGLFMKYSAMAADADKKRNQAKEKLDVVKAELDRKIRLSPSVYIKVDKVTETMIAGAVLLQPEYKEANDALIEANYELSMIQGAVRALDHKRSALENEVKLWLGNYFSGPKEPRDIPGGKRIVDMARDRVAERQRDAINKKEVDKKEEGRDDDKLGKQRDLVRRRRG